jgi:hypothetical protein
VTFTVMDRKRKFPLEILSLGVQGRATSASNPVQGPGKLMKRKCKHKVSDDDDEWTSHNHGSVC